MPPANPSEKPQELTNPLLRSFVSLAIVVHLLCVGFVFSANVNPSQLQQRLAGVLGPYTQLLHLDSGGARLQLTDGSELSDDHEILVSPKLSDGSLGEANAVRFPSDEPRWSPARKRYLTLAADMSAYVERDDLIAHFARAIGSHVLRTQELEHVVVSVRHIGAEPFNENLAEAERSNSYNVYEAEVWNDSELGLQMQKRASGLGAAPTTRAPEGGS